MEIKGIQDIYKVHTPSVQSTSAQKTDDASTGTRNDNIGQDTISISPKGSFQNKINAEIKKYAAAAQTDTKISENRIQALKSKYYGDNCPVSGSDIASAMMVRVCGINI